MRPPFRSEQIASSFVLLALGCGGGGATERAGTWRGLAAMPEARQEVATAVLGEMVFEVR